MSGIGSLIKRGVKSGYSELGDTITEFIRENVEKPLQEPEQFNQLLQGINNLERTTRRSTESLIDSIFKDQISLHEHFSRSTTVNVHVPPPKLDEAEFDWSFKLKARSPDVGSNFDDVREGVHEYMQELGINPFHPIKEIEAGFEVKFRDHSKLEFEVEIKEPGKLLLRDHYDSDDRDWRVRLTTKYKSADGRFNPIFSAFTSENDSGFNFNMQYDF